MSQYYHFSKMVFHHYFINIDNVRTVCKFSKLSSLSKLKSWRHHAKRFYLQNHLYFISHLIFEENATWSFSHIFITSVSQLMFCNLLQIVWKRSCFMKKNVNKLIWWFEVSWCDQWWNHRDIQFSVCSSLRLWDATHYLPFLRSTCAASPMPRLCSLTLWLYIWRFHSMEKVN